MRIAIDRRRSVAAAVAGANAQEDPPVPCGPALDERRVGVRWDPTPAWESYRLLVLLGSARLSCAEEKRELLRSRDVWYSEELLVRRPAPLVSEFLGADHPSDIYFDFVPKHVKYKLYHK